MDDRQPAGDGRRIGRRRVLVGTAALGGAALLGGAAAADAAEPPPRAAAAQGRDTLIDGPAGRLAVWEKWPAGTARGVALLVHGATYPGQTAFDFSFPGGDDYSLMDYLVERGLGTVTFSVRGYGRSDAPADGFSVNLEAGIADLSAVADWLATRGYPRPYLLGWSWGGAISARYAERRPERVERLVLYAPAMGAGIGGGPRPSEGYQVNSIEQVLGRIEPELTDPAARQAFAELAVQSSPRSPNGGRTDDLAALNTDSPLTCPTLMIYGAVDRLYQPEWVGAFFARLATDDKALVVVPGAGHFLVMQRPRQRLYEAAERFLQAPPAS